jgi:hypothetical protein
MAASSFITASAGTTDAMGAWSHTSAAPGAAGRLLMVHLVQDGTNATRPSITSVTNAEDLAGTDSVLTYLGEFGIGAPSAFQHVWMGRSLSTSAMVITGANAGNDDIYVRVYEFSNVSTGPSVATVIENVTAGATTTSSGTGTSVTDAAVTTLDVERLALNLCGMDDDLTGFDGTFTGMTGGTWASVASYGSSTGTDASLNLQTATMTDIGTIDGGSMTITSMGWGVVGFALLPLRVPRSPGVDSGNAHF